MPRPVITQTVTIASGDQLSGAFSYNGQGPIGIWCPTVTSATLIVYGSYNTTAANYVPIQNEAGSGDFTLAMGVGSLAFTLKEPILAYPSLKLFSGVAQAAPRSFIVVTKP